MNISDVYTIKRENSEYYVDQTKKNRASNLGWAEQTDSYSDTKTALFYDLIISVGF